MNEAAALEALPKIAQVEELMVAIGTVIGREFLVIDAQGIAHLMRRRAPVLGLTKTRKSPSALAILSVVRRDHFRPVIGSPAVSYSSRNSISLTMSAVFFDWSASAAGTARAVVGYILIEQLLASAGDSVRIQAEELGQNGVAAV